jgi:hypothetical protein
MLPFVLYFVAGAVTAFHVSTFMFAAYGGPSNPLALVSLLGSFALLIAAYLSLFKPHAAGRIALIAALAIWCFYGPAIANIVRAHLGNPAAAYHQMLTLTGGAPKMVLLETA